MIFHDCCSLFFRKIDIQNLGRLARGQGVAAEKQCKNNWRKAVRTHNIKRTQGPELSKMCVCVTAGY